MAGSSRPRALSIRQPYVEQILQGTKKVEYRTRPTKMRGQVYIYAASKPGPDAEFARVGARPGDLPVRGILGTVEIVDCTGVPGDYQWHLANPKRLLRPLKPHNHPQPAWFFPFRA